MIRFWLKYVTISCINSVINALVELYTLIRSMLLCIYWMGEGCTKEYIVEDENGEIIHCFPQLNFKDR